MKTIKIFITLILVGLLTTGLYAQKKKKDNKSDKGNKDEITVQVDGLGCRKENERVKRCKSF